MAEDAAVQVMSRLGLDYSQAIKSTEDLAKALAGLNESLLQLEGTAKQSGKSVAQAMRDSEQRMLAAVKATGVGTTLGEKVKRDFGKELLKMERNLQDVIVRAQRAGVDVEPMRQMVAEIQQLQQATDQIGSAERKRITTLKRQIELRKIEVGAAEKAITAERERIQASGRIADATQRITLAQEQSNKAASQATLLLSQQLNDAERLAHQHGILAARSNVQSRTIQEQLDLMRQQLQPILAKIEAGKQLNATDISRLNHLRDQNVALQQSVKLAQSEAALEAQKAKAIEAVRAAKRKAALEDAELQRRGELQLATLQAQVAKMQRKIILGGISNKEAGREGVTLQSQLNSLRLQVAVLQEKWRANRRITPEMSTQLQLLEQQRRVLYQQIMAQSQAVTEIESMARRRISWFLTGSFLFGSAAIVRSAVASIRDIEMQMVLLRRVMEDPLFDVDKMRSELFELGREFGFAFDQVAEIAVRWSQTGMDMRETLDATRASLLGLNTAEMDVEASTTSLIGIMSTWGFEASQLEEVIDKLNITSDRFPVTTQDLIDALLRAGGTARAAGIEFEQLVGMVTAMREASGRAGSEIGNALNAIIAFSQRDIFMETAQELGIPVFVDAVTKKMRPMFEIMTDIAENWERLSERTLARLQEQAEATGLYSEEIAAAGGALEEWTDIQRRDLVQAAAQNRRRPFLIALMENFARVQEVINIQERALGHSMRQNEMTMETYEKKVNQLQISWQEFAYTIAAEGGVLDGLKELVDWVRRGVSWFTGLNQQTQRVIITVGKLVAVYGLINMVLRMITGSGIIQGMGEVLAVVRSLGTSLAGLGTFLAGPYGIAIGAAVLALGGLVYWLTRTKNAADEVYDAFRQSQREMDEQITKLQAQAKVHADTAEQVLELANEYRNLNAVIAETDKADQLRAESARARQFQITSQVKQLLDEESAARLINARFAQEATSEIVKAETDKADAVWAAVEDIIAAKQTELAEHLKQSLAIIEAIEEQGDAWQAYMNGLEKVGWWIARLVLRISRWTDNLFASISDSIRKGAQSLHDFLERTLPSSLREVGVGRAFIRGASSIAQGAAEVRDYFERNIQITETQLANLDEWFRSRVHDRASDRLLELYDVGVQLEQRREGLRSKTGTGEFEEFKDLEHGANQAANAVRNLTRAIMEQVDAVSRQGTATRHQIALLEARIAHNTREEASLRDLAQADQDSARLLELLAKRQRELHKEAEAGRKALAALEAAQNALNRATEEGNQAYIEVQQEMDRLKDRISGLSVEWWRLETQIATTSRVAHQASREFADAMDAIAWQARLGILAVEEQARLAHQAMSGFMGLTASEQERFISDQANRYRKLLADELAAIEEAYRDRLKAVEEWADGEIAARQRLIDQLDAEQEQENREEEERKHLQTLEDLQEQRRYHELRTGREHREAIVDIDRRINEEQIRWQRQVEEWRRRDRQNALREEIDDIKRQADRRRDELQRHYEAVRADFNEHNIAMIAAAAALDPEWFERGRAIAQNLIEGFRSGDLVGIVLGELAALAELAAPTVRSGVGSQPDARRQRDIALLNAKREWEAAKARGDTAGMAAAAQKAARIRASGPTSDPDNTLTADELQRIIGLQHGGFIRAGQPVMGLIGEGASHELVLPVHKAAPFFRETMHLALSDTLRSPALGLGAGLARALAPVERRLTQILKALQSGAVGAKIDRLLNVEHMQVADDVDMDIVSRQLARRIRVARI